MKKETLVDTSRSWSHVKLNRTQDLVDRMALIGSVDHNNGTVQPIGSGFIVADSRDDAGNGPVVICTAAHLLIEAEKHLFPETLEYGSNPFAPEPGHRLLQIPQMRGLKVFLWYDENVRAFSVLQGCLSRDSDLACLALWTGKRAETDERAPKILSINSDPLSVGDDVIAIGAPHFDLGVEDWVPDGPAHVTGEVGVEIRRGSISRILDRGRLARVPVYETTIPLPGGFSGGPVMRLDRSGEFIGSVVGVVSSDIPDELSANNYDQPGCSYAIPAEWLHTLKAPNFDDPSKEGILVDRGMLKDIGKRQRELCVRFNGAIVSLTRRSNPLATSE